MSANVLRGEVEVIIDGKPEIIRLSFGAVRKLRDHFKAKSVQEILSHIDKWTPEDWIQVFAEGLRAGSLKDVSADAVADMIVLTHIPYYVQCLGRAMDASLVDPTMKKMPEAAAVDAATLGEAKTSIGGP